MKESINLRIVYIGWLFQGGTSLHRLQALKNLGHTVIGIDATPHLKSWFLKFSDRVSNRLFRFGFDTYGCKDRNGENAAVLKLFRESKWDILWIDKGMTIESNTFNQIRQLQPSCQIIGYSPDDMYVRHNQSRLFLQSLPFYDIYFTTKSFGVSELKSLGAKEVHFVDNAYQSSLHYPIEVDKNDQESFGGNLGFIGTFEDERYRSIKYLAENGFQVRVWGSNWPSNNISNKLRIERRCLYENDYVKAVCSFDINLGFLRKINRDQQTTRSVEIPACGAFMLAERTHEHQVLFKEGKEAEYFDSDEELLSKVRYYLTHENERKRIAAAGRERCINSGYSNEIRLSKMLKISRENL